MMFELRDALLDLMSCWAFSSICM